MRKVRWAVCAVVVLTVLTGFGWRSAGPTTDRTGVVTVLAIGDSITEADSPDFDDGDVGPGSWARYAATGPVQVLGGWAHGGATTADMLIGISDRRASSTMPHADVLVLMAGSNDVDAGESFPDVAAHLHAIAQAAGIPRVVLSTIPPEDAVAPAVRDFNAELPALAQSEGWQLVDPMTGIRDDEGRYGPGMTSDGVHPSVPAARLIGRALHRALVT